MNRPVFIPTSPHAPIARRTLGQTGVAVSELCLGTMNFGWRLDRDASFGLLDRYRRAGGNFLQAVSVDPDGSDGLRGVAHPETFVGDWLAERGARRRDWFISTRLALRREGGARAAERIRSAVERSLARLGVDELDLLVCEWMPTLLPLDEMLVALDGLIAEGKLRYYSLAGFPVWRARDALARAHELGLRRAEALQCDYSLLRRREAEDGPAAFGEADAPGLIASSPLAGGFLANPAYAPGGLVARRMGRQGGLRNGAREREVLSKVVSVARAHAATEARVAIAWCLAQPWTTSVVVGASTPDHLDDVLAAGRLLLSKNALAELDAVSAPPPFAVQSDVLSWGAAEERGGRVIEVG